MKITLLESSVGAGTHQQILASYMVNDSVVIDAGSVGFVSPLEIQKKVEHVFLSHSHIDHLASLPIFVDNVYVPGSECPTIYAGAETLDCVKKHIFNDTIWPDMIRLSAEETPFLKLSELSAEQSVTIGNLTVTPVALNHVVPTFGFVLDDGEAAVAIVSDTNPTDRIWEVINANDRIKAVLLESSFPNSFEWLAEKAMHLTPNLFKVELDKLKHDVPIIAIHIKIAFEPTVREEIESLGLPNVQIGEPGRTYEFH